MPARILLLAFAEVAVIPPYAGDSPALSPLPEPSPVVAEDICNFYNDCRPLTAGEARLGHSLYGEAIDYEAVRIVNGRYLGILPIGDRYTGISPDGNIYVVAKSVQSEDYSAEPEKAHFFVHELYHIKQRNEGMNLLGQAFSLHAMYSGDPYTYELEEGATIGNYNMEQQASLAEDGYALSRHLHSDGVLFSNLFAGLDDAEKCIRWRLLDEILVRADVTIGPVPALCR